MTSIIPNSTPTPNVYYDDLMWLLTDREWKVLTYAVRRILGFEKNRLKLKAIISLSTFENGVTVIDEDTGKEIRLAHGCGLNRPAIKRALNALVEHGVMIAGPVTSEGQVWELQVDYDKINRAKLEKRHEEQRAKGRKRTAKATQTSAEKRKKDNGTSSVPAEEVVRPAYQGGYVQRTDSGTSGVHIESNRKATGKQVLPAPASGDGPPVDSDTPEPKFKVGDWVKDIDEANIGDYGDIAQVFDVVNAEYYGGQQHYWLDFRPGVDTGGGSGLHAQRIAFRTHSRPRRSPHSAGHPRRAGAREEAEGTQKQRRPNFRVCP